MLSRSTVIVMLILSITIDLPGQTQGQFWKIADNSEGYTNEWRREMIAFRKSGICYKTQHVETLNPALSQRQISYCCDGYVNQGSPMILKCEPICEEDCAHGICISPGNCECEPGYYRVNASCRQYGE
ncbi:hypothetical protein KR222_009185 [Zaprionus bogoriensis]|nr:hypothetical protein KR222_009185 [Zaprionus bogoriensis]